MAVSAAPLDRMESMATRQVWDHDPGGTGAVIVSPDGGTTIRTIDMRDYTDFLVIAIPHTIGGNGVTLLEIVAATDAAMTTPVVVRAHAATVADALGDYVVLSIQQSDLAATGTEDLRYVAGRLTCATGTDEVLVYYEALPKRPRDGLTATTIA